MLPASAGVVLDVPGKRRGDAADRDSDVGHSSEIIGGIFCAISDLVSFKCFCGADELFYTCNVEVEPWIALEGDNVAKEAIGLLSKRNDARKNLAW